MFPKLIVEMEGNKSHSIGTAQRIIEDKREDKNFSKLPLATSSIQKVMG